MSIQNRETFRATHCSSLRRGHDDCRSSRRCAAELQAEGNWRHSVWSCASEIQWSHGQGRGWPATMGEVVAAGWSRGARRRIQATTRWPSAIRGRRDALPRRLRVLVLACLGAVTDQSEGRSTRRSPAGGGDWSVGCRGSTSGRSTRRSSTRRSSGSRAATDAGDGGGRAAGVGARSSGGERGR